VKRSFESPFARGDVVYHRLFNGYIYDSGVSSVALRNVPAGSYNLYLYSEVGPGATHYSTTFTLGAAVQTVTNAGDLSTFVNSVNYTEFVGVSPVAGTISFTFSDPTLTYGILNGFQLVAVPEPSSFALGGIGLAVAAFAARRKRQRGFVSGRLPVACRLALPDTIAL